MFIPIFLHLPKTAGSSIRHILSREYNPSMHLIFSGDKDQFLRFMELGKLNWYPSVVHGHVPYGIHTFLPGPAKYFTFLRDPYKRFLSDFKFSSSKESGFYREMGSTRDIHRFLELRSPLLSNPYAKWLGGFHPLVDDPPFSDPTLEKVLELFNQREIFLGITEYFDSSILLIAREFKWDIPLYLPSNRSIRSEFTLPEIDLPSEIHNNLSKDWRIYTHARECVSKMIKAEGRSFKSVLSAYRRLLRSHLLKNNRYNSFGTYVNGRDPVIEISPCLSLRDRKIVRSFLEFR